MTETLPSPVQREHLTKVLCQYGALRDGHVREVVVESSRPTLLSRIIRLRLEYEGDAGDAPLSVIFKTGLPERLNDSWTGGRQEVAFYTQVAAVMSDCLVPRCFEAHWDADTHAWHVLLEDLTDTHVVATTWPLPPTTEQCEQILQRPGERRCSWVGVGRPWGRGPDLAQGLSFEGYGEPIQL